MSMMYQRRSRLTPRQQSELIELIVADAPARESAELVGLLKCGSKVFTAIIPDTCTRSLLPIIVEMVPPDSITYADAFKAYNALDLSDFRHSRINHSKLFADRHNHINGIENFWNQAKINIPIYGRLIKCFL